MKSLFIGGIFLLIAGALSLKTDNASIYWEWHSFWIVGIGTIALLFMTFPMSLFKSLGEALKALFKQETSLIDFQDSLLQLAKRKTKNVSSENPVITYAQQLWEQGVNPDMFVVLLSERRTELDARNLDTIHSLKNLSKYPPALGMVGTIMGMIDLFSALDKNQERIGSALSTAMTATLLGLIISNFIISPLADRLHVKHIKEQRLNTSLYEILLLINSNEPLSLIDDEVKNRAA